MVYGSSVLYLSKEVPVSKIDQGQQFISQNQFITMKWNASVHSSITRSVSPFIGFTEWPFNVRSAQLISSNWILIRSPIIVMIPRIWQSPLFPLRLSWHKPCEHNKNISFITTTRLYKNFHFTGLNLLNSAYINVELVVYF